MLCDPIKTSPKLSSSGMYGSKKPCGCAGSMKSLSRENAHQKIVERESQRPELRVQTERYPHDIHSTAMDQLRRRSRRPHLHQHISTPRRYWTLMGLSQNMSSLFDGPLSPERCPPRAVFRGTGASNMRFTRNSKSNGHGCQRERDGAIHFK